MHWFASFIPHIPQTRQPHFQLPTVRPNFKKWGNTFTTKCVQNNANLSASALYSNPIICRKCFRSDRPQDIVVSSTDHSTKMAHISRCITNSHIPYHENSSLSLHLPFSQKMLLSKLQTPVFVGKYSADLSPSCLKYLWPSTFWTFLAQTLFILHVSNEAVVIEDKVSCYFSSFQSNLCLYSKS